MGLANSKVLLIGFGNMGYALSGALDRSKIKYEIVEQFTQKVTALAEGIKVYQSVTEVEYIPDCIILAVKPQSMDELLPKLVVKFGDGPKPFYLSIAAGKTFGYFKTYLKHAAIIRAMPNTPALIGKGITVLCGNQLVSEEEKFFTLDLMKATGKAEWIEDETLLDAVTAISGSGPAYVFLFMEAMISAAIQHKLPEKLAKELVVETVMGAASLVDTSPLDIARLRENVTSPGGTTEAALDVLKGLDEKNRTSLSTLMEFAILQAIKRAKEIA